MKLDEAAKLLVVVLDKLAAEGFEVFGWDDGDIIVSRDDVLRRIAPRPLPGPVLDEDD